MRPLRTLQPKFGRLVADDHEARVLQVHMSRDYSGIFTVFRPAMDPSERCMVHVFPGG